MKSSNSMNLAIGTNCIHRDAGSRQCRQFQPGISVLSRPSFHGGQETSVIHC